MKRESSGVGLLVLWLGDAVDKTLGGSVGVAT